MWQDEPRVWLIRIDKIHGYSSEKKENGKPQAKLDVDCTWFKTKAPPAKAKGPKNMLYGCIYKALANDGSRTPIADRIDVTSEMVIEAFEPGVYAVGKPPGVTNCSSGGTKKFATKHVDDIAEYICVNCRYVDWAFSDKSTDAEAAEATP